VTRLDAKNPKPFFGRGEVYAQKMQYKKAIGEYSEAIRLDPRNPEGYLKRSELYSKTGDLNKSFEDSMKSWEFLDYSPGLPRDRIGDFPYYDDPPPSK
jgi:tetratricopeptide (TPR) repeat protein